MLGAGTWSQFGTQLPDIGTFIQPGSEWDLPEQQYSGYDTSIPSVRALTQAIDNSQTGAIQVRKESSAYVIAMQNSGIFGSFSVTADALHPGMFLISKSSFGGLAAGGGVAVVIALVLAVALSQR